MNIYDILHQLGYQVHGVRVGTYNVSRIKDYKYNIRNTEKVIIPPSEVPLQDRFNIEIKSIGFNDYGNLVITFYEIRNPNKIFDIYEYNNNI